MSAWRRRFRASTLPARSFALGSGIVGVVTPTLPRHVDVIGPSPPARLVAMADDIGEEFCDVATLAGLPAFHTALVGARSIDEHTFASVMLGFGGAPSVTRGHRIGSAHRPIPILLSRQHGRGAPARVHRRRDELG